MSSIEPNGSDFDGLIEAKKKEAGEVIITHTWYVDWSMWLERIWKRLKGGDQDGEKLEP